MSGYGTVDVESGLCGSERARYAASKSRRSTPCTHNHPPLSRLAGAREDERTEPAARLSAERATLTSLLHMRRGFLTGARMQPGSKAHAGTSKDREVPACPVCLDTFATSPALHTASRFPKRLPCQHTLCEGCVNDLRVEACVTSPPPHAFPCPVCRKEVMCSTPLPDDSYLLNELGVTDHNSRGSPLHVVIDGLNVAWWFGSSKDGGSRDWYGLAVCCRHFVSQGVRPIIVLKKQAMEEVPSSIRIMHGTKEHRLRDFLMLAPPAMAATWDEEDDVVVLKLSEHYIAAHSFRMTGSALGKAKSRARCTSGSVRQRWLGCG